MADGMSRYLTAAGPSGGQKRRDKLVRGSLVLVLRSVAHQADGYESWSSGDAVAPRTQPTPPRARLLECVNSAMLDGSAWGATAGNRKSV